MRHILDLLASDDRPTDMDRITLEDVRWLANHLGVKDSTKAEYIRTLSRASIARGGPDWGKQLDILYNRRQPERVWITMQDFILLYKEADPTTRLILVLGAFMGLRRFEIAGLRDEDYDERRGKLLVRGKGHGPEGLIDDMDVPEPVAREIASFRRCIVGLERRGDGLVQAVRWEHYVVDLTDQAVAKRVKTLGETLGIEVRTHSLRRLYATTLVNQVGAEYDTVKRLMRHADISTTLRCYVQADPTKMRAATDALMGVYAEALGF